MAEYSWDCLKMTLLSAQELNSRATIHDAREETIKEYLSRTSGATEEILH